MASIIGSSLAALGLFMACSCMAQSAPQPPQGQIGKPQAGQGQQRERRGPPPEALAACQALASGAACSFLDKEGKPMSGACFSPQASLPLACRPGGSPGGQGGPQGGPAPQGQAGTPPKD